MKLCHLFVSSQVLHELDGTSGNCFSIAITRRLLNGAVHGISSRLIAAARPARTVALVVRGMGTIARSSSILSMVVTHSHEVRTFVLIVRAAGRPSCFVTFVIGRADANATSRRRRWGRSWLNMKRVAGGTLLDLGSGNIALSIV